MGVAALLVRLIPDTIEVPDPPARPGRGSFALCLGRVDVVGKGLDLLIDACGRAGDDALPMVIAGSGTRADERRLNRLARPMPGRVVLVGYVGGAEKTNLLNDAAFLVMPSRRESFGLVALEAMAYGRPVVHFALPELSWIPDDCGVKVPRERLGRNARAFAARHDPAATDDAYAEVVREVLAGRNRSGQRGSKRPCPSTPRSRTLEVSPPVRR